eukprot:1493995-Pleurochrysis_carterae.AAC.3
MGIDFSNHMSESSEMNACITTFTAQAKLTSIYHIDGKEIIDVVHELDGDEGFYMHKRDRSFKNSVVITRVCDSIRGIKRRIAIKVFANMTLHVTGCHSTEMLHQNCAALTRAMQRFLTISAIGFDIVKVTMVNYKMGVCLKTINLKNITSYLRANSPYLVLYDALSTDTAVNIKFEVEKGAGLCSIRLFKSGKSIVSTPLLRDRDGAISQIADIIENDLKPLC